MKRVVITGMGVVSPNAVGINNFIRALKKGKSGIKKIDKLEQLNYRCQVAGIPPISEKKIKTFKSKYQLEDIVSSGIIYGCIAAVEAMKNAQLPRKSKNGKNTYDDMGCIFGTGSNGAESTIEVVNIFENNAEKIHNNRVVQSLSSCVSSYIASLFGLGGQITSNSSACSTGTEALLEGYHRIINGIGDKYLVGSSESSDIFVWSPFDAMFATARGFNNAPTKASRPLNADASGFVPSAGAGALVIESLDSALKRGANIYAEVIGGAVNSGGQRGGGSMTIGNPLGMKKCIEDALKNAKIGLSDLDLISGHLTSTVGDIIEMGVWNALFSENSIDKKIYINSVKSMIGHSLSASGSIESIATIVQMNNNFVHVNKNAIPLHPDIAKDKPDAIELPIKTEYPEKINLAAKTSLGFGDVNACVVFKKYNV